MIKLFYLLMMAAVVCLITFQTNRSIYVRSLGLFLLMALILSADIQTGLNWLLVIGSAVFLTLGFASDFYSASLRTWFFRVSDQAIWGLIIGGFVCGALINWIPSLLPFVIGSLLGALVGEIRSKGFRSFTQIGKAVLGTFGGVFGMSTKLLLGLEMINWFLIFHRT